MKPLKIYVRRMAPKAHCPPRKPVKKIVWSVVGAFAGIYLIALLGRYAAALGMHRLVENDRYVIVTGREGTITGPVDLPVQADGDVVTSLPLRVGVESRPLTVLRPD